jgi:hypothetical protein
MHRPCVCFVVVVVVAVVVAVVKYTHNRAVALVLEVSDLISLYHLLVDCLQSPQPWREI